MTSASMRPNLTDVDLPTLVERLTTLAREVRSALASGETAVVGEILDHVRRAADVEAHDKGLVLQTAEAFLRAVGRTDLGRTEKALRDFVDAHPEGTDLLGRAAAVGGLGPSELGGLDEGRQAAIEGLLTVGSLRRLKDGRIDVPPSLRGVVRDLVEPLAFRLWRRVEEARARIAYQKHDLGTAALAMAAHLGVSENQARTHLQARPISPTPAPPAQNALPERKLWVAKRERYVRKGAAATEVSGFPFTVEPTGNVPGDLPSNARRQPDAAN